VRENGRIARRESALRLRKRCALALKKSNPGFVVVTKGATMAILEIGTLREPDNPVKICGFGQILERRTKAVRSIHQV
jgi:hypothetical protein